MAGYLRKTGSFLGTAFLCGVIIPCTVAPAFAQTAASESVSQASDGEVSAPVPLRVTIPNLQAVQEQQPPPDTQPLISQAPVNTPPAAAPTQQAQGDSTQETMGLSSSVGDLANKLLSQLMPQEYRSEVALSPDIIMALNEITPMINAAGDGVVIHSDGILIHKEVEHYGETAAAQPADAMQMAALAPAAGGDAPPADTIAPAPLIAEVPTTIPTEPPAPIVDIKPEDIQPLLDAQPIVPAAPAEAPAPATATTDIKPDTIVPLIDSSASGALPPTEAAAGNPTEPKRELSEASKKMIDKVPSHINRPRNEHPAPFSVDHAKNAPDSKADDSMSVKHESMGIKIEIKAQKFDSNYELSKAYDAMLNGQSSAAIEIYKQVLDNDPNNKNALFGLATMYHRAGQLELARPMYARLLAIDPNDRDGLNNFLVLLGDEAPESALAQMEKLEERNPQFSPIPAQMAVIYEKLGNMDKASEKMFAAIKLAPENLTYRYNLAIMLDKQHKYEEAADLYRQIIDAYQKGSPIPGNLDKIQQRLTFISSNRH